MTYLCIDLCLCLCLCRYLRQCVCVCVCLCPLLYLCFSVPFCASACQFMFLSDAPMRIHSQDRASVDPTLPAGYASMGLAQLETQAMCLGVALGFDVSERRCPQAVDRGGRLCTARDALIPNSA